MNREWKWYVTLKQAPHVVTCVPGAYGNSYVLYVDDAFLTKIYRKSFESSFKSIDEEVMICGEKFRFVVWNGEPDLVIEDRMQRGNTDYETAKQRREESARKWGAVLVCIAAALLLLICVVAFAGGFSEEDRRSCVTFGLWAVLSLSAGIRLLRKG